MQKKTVFLLQDSDKANQELEKQFSEDERFLVVGAQTDGDKAIEMILSVKPNFVITEIILTGCDGLSVIEKTLSMYNDIPSIMTFNECKDILKVGKNTLLDLLHSNIVQGFKIGNRWKIPKESVVEFIRYA